MSKHSTLPIDKGWVFKQADDEQAVFLPVSQFPTNVHLDLMRNDVIPDPFIGKHEDDVQWIGEVPWIYRTTFATPDALQSRDAQVAVLAFDGLDTFATVTLNGQEILKTESMFIPERVDVTTLLRSDADNELEIMFESAYLEGWKLVEKHPHHQWGCWNGDNSRLAVRKAQYHWGWDWGPALLTCGPWRPVTLETYQSRLADLAFKSMVDPSLESAHLKITALVEGSATDVNLSLVQDGIESASERVSVQNGQATATFILQQPKLWYPARYGDQPLYTIRADLLHDGVVIHTRSKRCGLRRAELIQRPLEGQPGTSFFFKINNIPIFCGGSNWIPADSFIPRITPQRYYDWVKLVVDGNQVMIRVWGGGIYEEQAFYDACDELGVLVWQDFMFGCGNYPAFPHFLELVKAEAEANIRRLRHHPSIVIWAGNNEDYQYAESENLTYDIADPNPDSWLRTNFPARYIYEKILPEACNELDPDRYYHPGCPWGGVDTRDPTVGDIHQWNVWHGTQEKYQDFDKLVGRFVSEFGMEAFPSIKTIDAFLPLGRDDPDRYAQSATMDFHNKAAGHERRLALYLAENLRYSPDSLEQYIYATQLMQGECLASAYRLWKRQWKGPHREYCSGALVWQINDCWPVTSWSIADYYLRPKHAYYTVKREMAPISCGMTRRAVEIPQDKYTRVRVDKKQRIEVWGSNLTLRDFKVDVVVKAWDLTTGTQAFAKKVKTDFLLPQNCSTEVCELEVPATRAPAQEEDRVVVAAYLLEDGRQIARYVNWPEPLKYNHFQKPRQLVVQLTACFTGVEISAEVPVKGLALECEDDGVVFEDNLIDIVPGEQVLIKVRGAGCQTVITARYLGMDIYPGP